MTHLLRASVLLTLVLASARANAADVSTGENFEYFEKHVRPLFVQHCQECHGSKKQEAGLRLDTRAGFLKGADGGPVFKTETVVQSPLLEVVQYKDGGTQMPPKGKLADESIAVIRQWLEMGAPWPADTALNDTGTSAKDHWAFRPVTRPAIPGRGLLDGLSNETPIDSFIADSLRTKGLAISKPATRETFIRRVTFDLWGIPPTMECVNEFVNDRSPDACERLIDRLLASPLYGQRWGRHWLDIARYADSKGYVFLAEPRYPYSYTYRDYVVDSFNKDVPFDQFVIEQLAADQIASTETKSSKGEVIHDERLAALGFLTVGRRYLNNPHDIIDDRIDVVARGLQGLTVGCARCHDHKFDPIPTADYYSLYGIFSSTIEPEESPLIGESKNPSTYQAFLADMANRETAFANYEKENHPKLVEEIREAAGDSLQRIAKLIPVWAETPIVFQGKNEPRNPVFGRWKAFLERTSTQPHSVFGPWHQLAKVTKAEEFPVEVNNLISSWANDSEATKVNPLVRQAISEQKPTNLMELARIYGKLLRDVTSEWTDQVQANSAASQLSNPAAEELRQILYGETSPANITPADARMAYRKDIRDTITKLKREIDVLRVTSPGAPPRAMAVRDGPIQEPVIFIRGNADRRGKQVPRQFLEAVSGPDRKPFTRGSGRLELAEAIVSPSNPLTARVIINRIWQQHFGTGIVSTPSDFGMRGEHPSHPQLLDWLAAEMVGIDVFSPHGQSANRWSIKRMHRLILASSVFRQSSDDVPVARSKDPENRLLWRMPRLRLDFEALRDSLLAVSGRLDDTMNGQPFNEVTRPDTARRTIYAFINRNDLPGIFRVFDFADTDSTAAERPQTTVPQQSLFAMNSPFMQEQARQLAKESNAVSNDTTHRVKTLFQRVFSRGPSPAELRMAFDYLAHAQTTPEDKMSPMERLAQVLLMTNEFVFVD